jgi:hypothetical protein
MSGRKMASGGRLILTNNGGISAVGGCSPTDGFYNKGRAQFFWQGDKDKLKYHMVK